MRTLSLYPRLVEQAYGEILEAICAGRLPPGAALAQERLAAQLDVSRQPIGQALALLKAQGFVSDRGRRGLMVAPIDADFAVALYEFRSAVDGLAARKAAFGRADVGVARSILSRGRVAADAGSIDGLITADMDFHACIYSLAGNQILRESMTQHWHHIRRLMRAILTIDGDWPTRVWDEHQTIVETIAAGDEIRAERLARRHVNAAADALRRRIVGTAANSAPPFDNAREFVP